MEITNLEVNYQNNFSNKPQVCKLKMTQLNLSSVGHASSHKRQRFIYTPAHALVHTLPLKSLAPLNLPVPPNSYLYDISTPSTQDMKKEVVVIREVRNDKENYHIKGSEGLKKSFIDEEVVNGELKESHQNEIENRNYDSNKSNDSTKSMDANDALRIDGMRKQIKQNSTQHLYALKRAQEIPSTFPRHEWKNKVLENHAWIKEIHDRVHPYNRTLEFVRRYDIPRKESVRQKLNENNENAIVQIILQHLLFEGLKETKNALCEALNVEYRNIDVDGSLLYELVKESVKKSEHLTDLIMDDNHENRLVDATVIEQELQSLGFEEDTQMDEENISVWDAIIDLNVVFDDKYVTSNTSQRGSSFQNDLTSRNISHASLNVLIIRLTQVTRFEYLKLERTWQGEIKSEESILKEVNKLFADNIYGVASAQEISSFVDIFLMTFPSFTTQQVFLSKMIDRFHVPKNLSTSEIQLIEKTVFRVLNVYVTHYTKSLSNKFIDDLIEFLREKEKLGYYEASHIIKNLESSLSSSNLQNMNQRPIGDSSLYPKPLYPHTLLRHNFQWHHVNPQELARQLTIIDFEFYRKIQSQEFMNLAWSKPKLKHRATNLLRMIERFNRLSRWAASVIVKPKQLSERRRIYGIILSIMDHLLQLGNFSSLMAFIGALSTAPVKRLKRTTSNPHSSLSTKLEQIREIMSYKSNQIAYRNVIKSRREQKLPTIPYLGFGQTTITMAEEGNASDTIPNPHYSPQISSIRTQKTLINWEKKALIHSIIDGMLYFQNIPYHLLPIHQVNLELTRLRDEVANDDELSKLSLEHGNEADEKHTV